MASAPDMPAALRDAAPTAAAAPAPVQQSLQLAPVSETPRRRPLAPPARAGQLWLCLYLPRLPLESLVEDDALPFAVFEEQQGVRQVLQVSAAAAAAGVQGGLSVNAALALEPALQLAGRDPSRECRVLQELAAWAERYTSFVSIAASDVLLLEIAASLRLFDGLKPLRRRIVRELTVQGYSAWPAIAPTPLAATWLARAGSRRCIVAPERLGGALGRLPLACLAWPAGIVSSLQGMGIAQVGELLRLPRDGFARRFGATRLGELDRALGRLPDPRDHYRSPPRFCSDLDLDGEQDDCERLLEACNLLLQKLERFLRTRQLAVLRLHFSFFHLREGTTPLVLGCLQAGQASTRWLELLRIRLEQLTLPAPVIAIRLRAAESQPLAATTAALGFGSQRRQPPPVAPLLERLAARIGHEALHGIGTVAEHRPDRAWRAAGLLQDTPHCEAVPNPVLAGQLDALRRRPLWLLETPEALACREHAPCYDGPLRIESGPERIETGWWDEAGIARDYYVACNPGGRYLWVFRNRDATGGWYLHGIFG